MSGRKLDRDTADAEMADSDFGDESDNTTFAGEQEPDEDESTPSGRGGQGGMDMRGSGR